mmetsp:Transcript_59312/g.126095  ORF Transcript_59312/g.126095 Transcript_59312/m.126095 type:complete len:112 (-) Transcript_59312:331-666(-)
MKRVPTACLLEKKSTINQNDLASSNNDNRGSGIHTTSISQKNRIQQSTMIDPVGGGDRVCDGSLSSCNRAHHHHRLKQDAVSTSMLHHLEMTLGRGQLAVVSKLRRVCISS